MRIGHPSWLPALFASLPLGAAAVTCPRAPAAQVAQSDAVAQARALDIARQQAALEGYDPAVYHVSSIEQDADGTWVVFFEHDAPAAPGQHCTVYVAPDGTTRVMHGR
ncbi:MAG: hypothetical protein HY905_08590 [Deltaproteobacteria bacterium]|nr:hypothetical protein [Deltaproteobacteria bacterium]